MIEHIKLDASNSTSGRNGEPNESRVMQRYFFHLHQLGVRIKDSEGQLLRDADEAWEAARAAAQALLASDPERTSEWLTSHFEVADHEGETILEFPFLEAVEARGEFN